MYLGAAYYPEHWPSARWGDDIALMKAAGFNVTRLAEFAWSTLEPEPGRYAFEWLAEAIDQLAAAGIETVLGTPSAAPPAWLTATDPETLAVDEYGRRAQHGNRCHYCVNAPAYHAAVARIATAMAARFGRHPHVIGWQIDNEYNRVCYCERCRSEFQRYLRDRYGTLEALNAAWSTAYWSQTYFDWAQVPIPIGAHNPGLMLAWRQFVTDSYRRFQRAQLDAVRPHLRDGAWITHNFMYWFDVFDHYALSADLDLAAWDYYVGSGPRDSFAGGLAHDLTRGFKRRNFWLMETQPGRVNWADVNTTLNQGEARAMAWQAIGHGADAVLYWQWRSAYGGQEQYHGSLLDQSGQPRLFYGEAQQIGRDLAAVGDLLAETRVEAKVAILNDYASRWSLNFQPHHRDFNYVEQLAGYARPLAARNIPVDVISADAALDGYRLVIVPGLAVLTPERVAALEAHVARRGHLLIAARTGVKDADNALLTTRPPGGLSRLTGTEVEEYFALPAPVAVKGNWFEGETRQWAERLRPLEPATTTVAARYGPSNGWLDGAPAITIRAKNTTLVYHAGVQLDPAAQDAFMQRVIDMSSLKPLLAAPAGVEVCARVRPDKSLIYVLINHTRQAQAVALPWVAKDHLTGQSLWGEARLEPYGVSVLSKQIAT
jgi:beta-galactosidase